MKLIWPLLMILSFGVFDMASTCIVYDRLGTFAYETGVLPNLFYSLGGIGAVFVAKMLLTTACAFALYRVAREIGPFDGMCKLMCLGATVVGLLTSISNLSGAFTGSTLFFFGLGIDKVAYAIFIVFTAAGLIDLALAYSHGRFVSRAHRPFERKDLPNDR